MTNLESVKQEVFKLFENQTPNAEVARLFGVHLRTVNRWKTKWRGQEGPTPQSKVKTEDLLYKLPEQYKTRLDPAMKRFVITGALNDSPLDTGFLSSLKQYCHSQQCQLLVVPMVYRNPDLFFKTDKEDLGQWPVELAGHYITEDTQLTRKLKLIASWTIAATARNPLSGKNGVSGQCSAIFAHPRQDVEYYPAGHLDLPRQYISTGVLTQPKYSASGAGGVASQAHTLGAVVVETEGDLFQCRHLEWRQGQLCDIHGTWTPQGQETTKIGEIVFGDVHTPFQDPVAWPAALQFVEQYRPKAVVCHDFLDCFSISHHDTKLQKVPLMKAALGASDLTKELESSFKELHKLDQLGCEVVMPVSNHHEHLDKWILHKGDTDPINFKIWVSLFTEYYKRAQLDEKGEIAFPNGFQIAMMLMAQQHNYTWQNLKWLTSGETYGRYGYDLSLHGHAAPGGARGSLAAFSKSVRPLIVGHSHKPGRKNRCLQVGTLGRLDRAYKMDSYNTWVHSFAIVYENGAAQLVNLIQGRWAF